MDSCPTRFKAIAMNKYKHILKNREVAAQKLLDVIPMQKLKDEDWKIVAVSKGGLVVGSHLIGKNDNDIDFLFSEPIMAPHNDECEIARVSETEEIVINEDLVKSFEIKFDYIYGEAHRKHEERILSCMYRFRKGEHFFDVKDKVILLVDDGAETGMKFMTALKTILAKKPKAVYIAVPVIPQDVLESLEPFTDDIFYLHDIGDYVETSLYYDEFEDISDSEIEKYLGA